MKLLIQSACLTLALIAALPSNAQVVRYGDCAIDLELITLPDCAVSIQQDRLYVEKRFVDDVFSQRVIGVAAHPIRVGKQRLAWTSLSEGGWAYFDRTGLVVVKNVATMDNGADEFHHGLVRVTKDKKWGLANVQGRIVVPMRYDGIGLDQNGGIACSGCRTITHDEHSWFSGGTWFRMDKRGKVLGRIVDPTLTRDHGQPGVN